MLMMMLGHSTLNFYDTEAEKTLSIFDVDKRYPEINTYRLQILQELSELYFELCILKERAKHPIEIFTSSELDDGVDSRIFSIAQLIAMNETIGLYNHPMVTQLFNLNEIKALGSTISNEVWCKGYELGVKDGQTDLAIAALP